MKKMKLYSNAKWLLAGLLFAACSQDDNIIDDNGGKNAQQGVSAEIEPFELDDPTRTTLTLDENIGLTFAWGSDDVVGVFGNSGTPSQTSWNTTPASDVTKATFTSNNFNLNAGTEYVAYYPYDGSWTKWKYYDGVRILVSYEKQTQTANASTAHLGAYDFLVSDAVTPTTENTAHFTFKHMGAAVRIKFQLPSDVAETFNNSSYADKTVYLSYTSENTDYPTHDYTYMNLFDNKYGCNGLENLYSTRYFYHTLSLSTDVTIGDDNTLTVWMMLHPVDLSGKNIGIKVTYDQDGDDSVTTTYSFKTSISGKNFQAGKAYRYEVNSSEITTETEEEGYEW